MKVSIFNADGPRTETEVDSGLDQEYIEAYLDVSADCEIIAISGITMGKVEIFSQGDGGY